jgi:endonuclease/exonuclease/phosphatase family metal-dependent hydrolase
MSNLRQSTKLKLMQLNAENLFIFLDEVAPERWRELKESDWQALSKASVPNKSLRKALALSESILDVMPHVVALNEVGGLESLTNFNRLFLNDLYSEYLIEGNSDRGIDVGYLVLKSWNKNFDLISHKDREINFLYPHERILLPKFRSHRFSRDCAELRVKGQNGETELILFLVHLKSKLDPEGIDPFGDLRRAAEVQSLVEIYHESKLKFPKAHHILLGDFNGTARLDEREPAFDIIYEQTDFRNALELADLDKELSTTQVQFSRSSGRALLQFDYIFLDKDLHEQLVKDETYVYRYKNEMGIHSQLPTNFDQKLLMPSDHYPVVVTINL